MIHATNPDLTTMPAFNVTTSRLCVHGLSEGKERKMWRKILFLVWLIRKIGRKRKLSKN